MKGTGVHKKALSGVKDSLVISGSHQAAALGDPYCFPFFVPVPGNICHTEVVLIAGHGEGLCSMLQQFPTVDVNGGIAFCQCHCFLLYDGFVLEK